MQCDVSERADEKVDIFDKCEKLWTTALDLYWDELSKCGLSWEERQAEFELISNIGIIFHYGQHTTS